jgi:hypothetical protein
MYVYMVVYIYTHTSGTAGAEPKILFHCFKPPSATFACAVHTFSKVPSGQKRSTIEAKETY